MKIGCHASVWTGDFDTVGLRRAIDQTAAAGFDLVELPLMDPGRADPAAIRRLVAEAGLTATGSLGLSADADLSSEDPEVVAVGEARLNQCLEFLAEAEGTHLVGVIYSAMRKYMAPASVMNRQHSVEAMGRVSERASALGVGIGVEVVNRYETNIVNTGRQALHFIDASGADNLTVHLDTYHMNIEEPDMFSPVLDVGEKLGYVHIGESHRGYLGSGTVDFDSFFRALERISYDGPVVFESFSSAVVDPDMSNMLGVWRNVWDDGEDLGRHANTFIRNQLDAVRSIRGH